MATKRWQKGVRLVDCESVINQRSSHALAGTEFLYEHVHLNFEGNYLVARSIAEQIESGLSQSANNPWPTEADCAQRLGWNDSARRTASIEILGRFSDAPFNTQADNPRQFQRLLHQIQQLQPALPPALRAETPQTKTIADAHPDDWVLQRNLARLQQQTGDIAGAAASLGRVTELLAHNADAWQAFGPAQAAAKNVDGAAGGGLCVRSGGKTPPRRLASAWSFSSSRRRIHSRPSASTSSSKSRRKPGPSVSEFIRLPFVRGFRLLGEEPLTLPLHPLDGAGVKLRPSSVELRASARGKSS